MNTGPTYIRGDGSAGYGGGIPELYEFPEWFNPGEGLVRSLNGILLTSFNTLAMICNQVNRLETLQRHNLEEPAIHEYTAEDVRNGVEGERGILAIEQCIVNAGGHPMPVPLRLGRAVREILHPYNPFQMAGNVAAYEVTDEELMMQQEHLGIQPITDQFDLTPPLGVTVLNWYMSHHYRNMARIFNKILARRMRRHLLPGSYNRRTRELAENLMEMKMVAMRMKHKIRRDGGGTPFACNALAGRATTKLDRLVRGL